MFMSAESAYIGVLFAVIALIAWAGAVDLTLALRSEMTISAWLRQHPSWFYVPLSGTLVLLAFLTLHLFVIP